MAAETRARVPKRLLLDEEVEEGEGAGGKVVVLEGGVARAPHTQAMMEFILGDRGAGGAVTAAAPPAPAPPAPAPTQ